MSGLLTAYRRRLTTCMRKDILGNLAICRRPDGGGRPEALGSRITVGHMVAVVAIWRRNLGPYFKRKM